KAADAQAEYERALAAYDRSFEMNPVASVLVASATVAGKLGHWVDAAQRYRRALAETEMPLDAKEQAKAQAALDAVMTNLGLVTLTIIPDGSAVALDGAELGAAPLPEALVLEPGDHQLHLKAEGYLELDTKFAVDAG